MRSHAILALSFLLATTTAAAEDAQHAPAHHEHGEHHQGGEPPAPHGHHERSDAFAPIGVMGEHTHPAGGFMISYRYARMRMEGNRDGDDPVGIDEIVLPGGSFMVSPTDMDMEVHMFGAMYAPADWLTLMAMIPYVKLRMDHVMASGQEFTTRSDGPGDLRLCGLFTVLERAGHHVHLSGGLGFPTGGIGHEDRVPVPMVGFANRRLPYPMQIGSGTWDLLPGITYTGRADRLSWGGQALGTVRLGHNRHGYRFGHRADATAWLAIPLLDWLSVSGRVAYAYWGNVHGEDDSLNPAAVPTADPDRREGHRIDLLGGLSVTVPLGPLGRHRFAVEAGGPVLQSLDGPQLETDWRVVAGWQLAF